MVSGGVADMTISKNYNSIKRSVAEFRYDDIEELQ